jgi:hypothetical protein
MAARLIKGLGESQAGMSDGGPGSPESGSGERVFAILLCLYFLVSAVAVLAFKKRLILLPSAASHMSSQFSPSWRFAAVAWVKWTVSEILSFGSAS